MPGVRKQFRLRWDGRRRDHGRRGNAIIEFTLVGIPIIFVLISTFEMARGMWTYHTLAYSIKQASRFTVVRGQGCAHSWNSCSVTVADVAHRIADQGVGLLPQDLSVTLTSDSTTVSCNPLTSCFSNATRWPPTAVAARGMQIGMSGRYNFSSALAMFWPGAGSVNFQSAYLLPADSREAIQF